MERRTNKIARSEILSLGDYDKKRDEIRASAMAARRARRFELGPSVTLTFENRETVLYQIQEMLRAERIVKDDEVQHEVETYSDLLPSHDELSATLMFEFPDEASRSVHLRDLVGFDKHLWLEVEGDVRSRAHFDRRQIDEDRISAVQFIRFPLDEAQRSAIVRGARVRIASDHPRYTYAADLTEAALRALGSDLEAAVV